MDGRKITTDLAVIFIFSPVWGLRPGRIFFSLIVHLPNFEILLDNNRELHENHTKSYQFSGSRISFEFETSK